MLFPHLVSLIKFPLEPFGQTVRRTQFTFPDRNNMPAQLCKLPVHAAVAHDIRFKLLDPELGSALRCIDIYRSETAQATAEHAKRESAATAKQIQKCPCPHA